MSIPRLNKETSLFSHSHSIEAGIRVLTDSVDSFVNMEDTYTDLNGDTVANKAASRIKQNADNIALRVEKNDIISSINQSPEAITIDASRVNIAGAAIFTSGSLSKVVRTSSEQWYSSTSPNSRVGGTWSTVQPDVSAGRYLWTRTYYSYSDGSSEYRPSEGGICVTPPTDIAGTVKSVDVEYAQTTSSTAQPTSGWSTVAPTVAAGKYLWTRTKTVLSDNSTTYTRATCISGDNGMAVTSAKEQYYLSSSYSATVDGTWSDDCPAWENGRYLWTRTFVTYADGHSAGVNATLATALNDACAKADTAISGVDVEYAQATSATVAPTDGWSTTAPRIASGRYLWTRTKTTYSSGASPTYTDAACISGDDGKLVKSAKEQYYLSTSSTAQSGGTWTDACPAWASDRYIWTRTHLTYADGTTGAVNVTLATALNEANRKANATITDLDVEYADSTSSATPPFDGWQTSAPAWQAGHYIWQRTKTVTPAGTSYSQPVCISGRDGVDGANGAAAYTYSINCNPSALVRATDGTLSPSSVSFSATRAQGTGNPVAYYGRLVIAEHDGSSWTDWYTGTFDEAARAYSPNNTAKAVRCNLYLAGGTTTLLDTQTVPIASDGAAGVAGADGRDGMDGRDGTSVTVSKIEYGVAENALTEPTYSTTVPTSIAKGRWLWVRTTYSDGSTAVNKSYVGTDGEDGTSIYVTSSSKVNGVTTVNLSDGTTMTIKDGEDGTDGDNGANGYIHTAWANSSDGSQGFSTTVSASKLYLGVYTDNTAADSTDHTKYSWSLIKGADGASPNVYTVEATPSALVRAADGTLSPSSISFAPIRAHGTGNPTAYAGRLAISEYDGATWTNKYTSSGDELYKTYRPTATARVVRCQLYLAGGTSTLLDTQSVPIAIDGTDGADGMDGADAYTVMLTNESHTFAGSTTAAIASSTTSQVIAYKGTTRVAATIGNIVGAPAGMSTSVTNNGSRTAEMTVSVTTALNTSDGVLMVPVTVDGNAFSLTFSWTVAFAGAKGDTGATGADGRGIVSIEEQYYLSTSNTTREGGSWATTPPPYETGKYYWTRSKITYDSGDPNYSFTEVTLANDITSIANVANGASLRHQTIWRSATSGTTSVSGTTNWVTDATGAQNKWTAVRPVYNSAFPILFTATQSQTMSQSGLTTCKCTTPVKDDTTTVIDGGHVTTGTIDASKVNVTNISASEISSGTLSADRIGASSVNADKLAANAVTAEKIRANAVTTAKIDALAVTADKVAAGAITADKVSAGAITTAKLAASAVTAEKISTGAITAEKIGAGAITADKIKANSLTVGLMDPSLMKTMSWYAESSTAASTATKVATIIPNVSSFTLSEGVCVRVKFSYTNSASVSTLALNVNSTGALSIVYTASGGGVSPIPVRGLIQAGRVYEFIYDGTYWVLQYGNDTFGKTRYESNILAAASISAGRIICGTRDGYRNLTAEASFDMSYPLLYAGKAIAAGGTGNDNYSRADNVSYSNNVSVTGGAANKVVYLKGELQGNTFHVANSAWLTTNVPTSDDGFKYIPLGIMSTSSVGYFEPSNAIWEYLDGEFGPSSFRESSLAAKTASYYVSEFGGGIRVHPKDEYDDNYLSIHSHGINVFREGVSVAFFGETVRVGALNSTNMTIDEDGFSMKHGAKAVARFGDTVGLGMSQMTKNSLTFRDYEGNHYVYFSDLRDTDTHITRVTETIIGDGALLYHDSRLTYVDGGYVSVSFDGGSYEYSVDASGDWIAVDIDRPLAVGHRMYLTYDTDSEEAKAFTLGIRKKNSTVGASSYALGFETTAEGVHSYALGHGATASGGDSCAIGLDAVAGADDTIAIGTDTHATAPTASAIGCGAVASAPFARAIGGGASGYASATLGGNASGPNSRSLVETATASGNFAVAMGYICTASGAHSLADGQGTNASGVCSHASGRSTNASYDNQFVCGMFNLPTSGDLFEVGNGNGGSYRSNAFRVTSGGVAYVGSAQVSSDGRVKSEVEPIDGGDALSLVMGLSPKSYVKFGRRELGFVAQDVEALAFGDVLVDESPNFGYDDFRNLSYDGLIAPIVSVEQSLVTQLGDASERIGRLEAENAVLRSRLYELESRVDMLLRAIGDDSR